MKLLTIGAAAAVLGLMGTAGAHAQIFVKPAPTYIYSPAPTVAPPTVVAPAYGAYAYVPAPSGTVVVNPRTGRSCRVEPDGYRWCWTP
jgi:hypothetical protein